MALLMAMQSVSSMAVFLVIPGQRFCVCFAFIGLELLSTCKTPSTAQWTAAFKPPPLAEPGVANFPLRAPRKYRQPATVPLLDQSHPRARARCFPFYMAIASIPINPQGRYRPSG